ncbi:putative Pdz domain (Also known as dhr or glgf) protein [Bradyrhizobium sp. STM 3843]|uniref:alpha/beta fold hydrolase n=1 Tax=Bradyrhizobium sp. STM 3843 TaxID=551947 RepID=UPI0002406662|nr:alpha/beta fold hydrolase [Bradyrhizobium sp. STM 3843]CCE04590.1 putative Pdz domain (Also known as dhr or glgf) protein [Bradyrhizobium sp. STM 3843]
MLSRKVTIRTWTTARCVFLFFVLSCVSATAARDLPRRPFLGVTGQPAPDKHVRVGKIFPESPAARSELAVGDILLALNGAPITSVDDFLAGVKSLKSKDRAVYQVQRGGNELDVEVTAGEFPREQPSGIQVLYDSVETPKAEVRSILTLPIGNTGKLPTIFYVQGWDCSSVDWPLPDPNLARELVYGLTRAGFAVMRAEKSGTGDSTGTPCRDVDFHDEVALFTSALKKLKTYDFVDTGNVFIFGHSAGGWVAPLMAEQEPVKGIVVYGTVVRPFAEYLVENWRRNRWLRSQSDLSQFDLAKVEDEQRLYAQLLHYLLVEKSSVHNATIKHPELSAMAKRLFPQDDEHFDNLRTLQHVRQLNDQNVARVWASLDAHVLALFGEYDIRTLAMDHEYIAAIINARHPSMGSWRLLPKMDHGFALHDSLHDSAVHEFAGPFGDQVLQETVTWIRGIVG